MTIRDQHRSAKFCAESRRSFRLRVKRRKFWEWTVVFFPDISLLYFQLVSK